MASVAPLRWVFTFVPECRSASYRNLRSPSPEYAHMASTNLGPLDFYTFGRSETIAVAFAPFGKYLAYVDATNVYKKMKAL